MELPYPSLGEVEEYWRRALGEVPEDISVLEEAPRALELQDAQDRHLGSSWVRFRGVDGEQFWCVWQPALRPSAQTLVHLPGYGTETSAHPSLVHAGYNVLHVNPRGYTGPDGAGNAAWRGEDGWALVLGLNLDDPERYGYRYWFQDAVIAVRWLQSRGVARVGLYGTSQGGGGALVLGSLLADEGIVGAVAADVPFLTDFRLNYAAGKYEFVFGPVEQSYRETWFGTLGYVDTTVHAPRMRYPVLLTLGQDDDTCPPDSIRALYDKLPHTRALVELHGQGHTHTPPFVDLARTWFDLYL